MFSFGVKASADTYVNKIWFYSFIHFQDYAIPYENKLFFSQWQGVFNSLTLQFNSIITYSGMMK